MPLYDWRCQDDKCGHEFEESVSLTQYDTKTVKCPKCQTEAKRVLSAMRSTHTSWKHWKL
jgi:putative FmdB family regulatory protein